MLSRPDHATDVSRRSLEALRKAKKCGDRRQPERRESPVKRSRQLWSLVVRRSAWRGRPRPRKFRIVQNGVARVPHSFAFYANEWAFETLNRSAFNLYFRFLK
jgi:hypothetical protein